MKIGTKKSPPPSFSHHQNCVVNFRLCSIQNYIVLVSFHKKRDNQSNLLLRFQIAIPNSSWFYFTSKKQWSMHFLKRVGLAFFQEFFTEEEEFISLIFPRTSFTLWRLYRKQVWYLDIIFINGLSNHEWLVMRPWKLSSFVFLLLLYIY